LNEVLTAIVKTLCDLQVQITTNTNAITTLNANYTIGCLSGVTASSDTHDIVQATINNLCSLNTAFSTLVAQLNLINVTSLNIDEYITNYLDNQPSVDLASSKMVPYAPIAYFGPLSNYPASGDSFDASGAGQNYWAKVYLCNGANPGVPDLRGWTLVGVTTGMFGGTLNPIVDPNIVGSGSPNYTISGANSLHGSTTVTLGVGEIPSHTHIIDTVVDFDDPGHSHTYEGANCCSGSNNSGRKSAPTTKTTSTQQTGITVGVTATARDFGGGGYHNNVQPSKGCYYIIYIP
jgi:microcystin-dependent protein